MLRLDAWPEAIYEDCEEEEISTPKHQSTSLSYFYTVFFTPNGLIPRIISIVRHRDGRRFCGFLKIDCKDHVVEWTPLDPNLHSLKHCVFRLHHEQDLIYRISLLFRKVKEKKLSRGD